MSATHHTGPNSIKKQKIDINPPAPKPVLTVILMLYPALVSVSRIFNAPYLISDGHIDWVTRMAFVPATFLDENATHGFMSTLGGMFNSAFSQFSITIWILNSLFLWVLGSHVERRLKGWRYPVFIATMVVTGWMFVVMTSGFNKDKLYLGPSLLLFGLLGAYFSYFPKKEHKITQWLRPTTEIYKEEDRTPINERYWVSPWLYVSSAFAVYEVLMQLGLTISRDQVVNLTGMSMLGDFYLGTFGRMQVTAAAFQPIAAGLNIVAGALVAQILPVIAMSLKPRRPGGKLQLEVVQHYRELRSLDLNHDQACEGAAKFAAVPIDVAKDWIAKGAAGLKNQDTQR